MKIGGATYNKNDLGSELQGLHDAGYDFAELDLGTSSEPNDAFISELQKYRATIPAHTAHLPEIDFTLGEISKCMKFIEALSKQNIRLFVMHLFSRNLSTEANFDIKIAGLQKIVDSAEDNGSVIALENTDENDKLLEKAFSKIPNLKFCLDVGHANLFDTKNCSVALIDKFSDRLVHVHIHDNKGGKGEKDDLHLPIGEGKIEFKPIIEKLKNVTFDGSIVLEVYNPDIKIRKASIEALRESIG